MSADRIFSDVDAFAEALRDLKEQRRGRVVTRRRRRRVTLTKAERMDVLAKTGGRCHICGGLIHANDWHADHVMAHSTGGIHAADNYLAAHSICNSYRWDYGDEEFQWILKLGVWLRSRIAKEEPIGREAGQMFCVYDRKRDSRRKGNSLKR